MTRKYACDVCGAEIREIERERVVVGLPPNLVITLLDFCPGCRDLVATAVVRLQALRAEEPPTSGLELYPYVRPPAAAHAPQPAWPSAQRSPRLESPIPAAQTLALPSDRGGRSAAVVARSAAYAGVVIGLVTLVTWLLAH